MSENKARLLAAMAFDREAEIGFVEKKDRDPELRSFAKRQADRGQGGTWRLLMRPDLPPEEAAVDPSLDSALRALRRTMKRADNMTSADLVFVSDSATFLRLMWFGETQVLRSAGRLLLAGIGWPSHMIDHARRAILLP
ncbi:hypothetical protein [Chelatococcus sp. XZ-Ab1]|uniref:hypothetical protein n=1 Tax=Chelatococcus sp. XZ-Ab1 TaxID=3034027 RepID=UPI0023E4692E|nr:hypothetical protein [Chelatococcus sp. XZ-Ab1]